MKAKTIVEAMKKELGAIKHGSITQALSNNSIHKNNFFEVHVRNNKLLPRWERLDQPAQNRKYLEYWTQKPTILLGAQKVFGPFLHEISNNFGKNSKKIVEQILAENELKAFESTYGRAAFVHPVDTIEKLNECLKTRKSNDAAVIFVTSEPARVISNEIGFYQDVQITPCFVKKPGEGFKVASDNPFVDELKKLLPSEIDNDEDSSSKQNFLS